MLGNTTILKIWNFQRLFQVFSLKPNPEAHRPSNYRTVAMADDVHGNGPTKGCEVAEHIGPSGDTKDGPEENKERREQESGDHSDHPATVFFDLDESSSSEENTEAEEQIGPLRSTGTQLSTQPFVPQQNRGSDNAQTPKMR